MSWKSFENFLEGLWIVIKIIVVIALLGWVSRSLDGSDSYDDDRDFGKAMHYNGEYR